MLILIFLQNMMHQKVLSFNICVSRTVQRSAVFFFFSNCGVRRRRRTIRRRSSWTDSFLTLFGCPSFTCFFETRMEVWTLVDGSYRILLASTLSIVMSHGCLAHCWRNCKQRLWWTEMMRRHIASPPHMSSVLTPYISSIFSWFLQQLRWCFFCFPKLWSYCISIQLMVFGDKATTQTHISLYLYWRYITKKDDLYTSQIDASWMNQTNTRPKTYCFSRSGRFTTTFHLPFFCCCFFFPKNGMTKLLSRA